MTDVVVAPVIPAGALPPGDADYAARMIARVDGPLPVVETPAVVAPVVPAPLLAGKYKTQAELEKGYLELQKQMSAPKPKPVVPPAKPAAVVPPVVDPTKPTLGVAEQAAADAALAAAALAAGEPDAATAAAEAAAAASGVDLGEMSTEFATNGSLSDESYTKLEAGGYPRDIVDQFIAGQTAIADRNRNEVFEITKGKDGYTKLVQWAAENLDAAEIAAYDAAVNGRDMNATKLAVTGLQARFAATEGTEPALIEGGLTSTDGYANSGELKAAMRDPRYSDPGSVGAAYRLSVQNKLAVSTY